MRALVYGERDVTHTSTEQPEALRLAYEIGANRIKVQPKEAERLRFEQWMAGHCWKVGGTWDGTTYRGAAENGDYLDPQAMHTRQLFAAWRDCAALRDHLEASQARVPLSDAQIDGLKRMIPLQNQRGLRKFARAIEAAHGITQEKQG